MIFYVIVLFLFCVHKSEQVQEPIVDKNTHKELPLQTNTYFSIRNQKTQRYLIWFGKNGTIPGEADPKQGKFWHSFTKSDKEFYHMAHYFGNHTIKIAKSHEEGFYQIFNKDCMYGNSPNGDCGEFGKITCFPPDESDYTEFNWVFTEKE